MRPVINFLADLGNVVSESIVYSIGTLYDAIDTFRFTFTYPEPDLLGRAEEGANQSRAMRLAYRIGMRRFMFLYKSRSDMVSRPKIVGARLFRSEASIQVKDLVQEIAGPWDDYHGNIPTGLDVLYHMIGDDDLCGFSRSDWKEKGKIEIVTSDGLRDNGMPRLNFHILELSEPITKA